MKKKISILITLILLISSCEMDDYSVTVKAEKEIQKQEEIVENENKTESIEEDIGKKTEENIEEITEDDEETIEEELEEDENPDENADDTVEENEVKSDLNEEIKYVSNDEENDKENNEEKNECKENSELLEEKEQKEDKKESDVSEEKIEESETVEEQNTESTEEIKENEADEQFEEIYEGPKNWTIMLYFESDVKSVKSNIAAASECKNLLSQMQTVENVTEYINSVKQKYPAEHYGLVLLNHNNSAPLLTVSSDENKNLSVMDLRRGIENSEIEKFDFIALDSNFAASIEYCYELKDCAYYLGGVEGFVEEDGFNYKKWLSKINTECTDGLVALSMLKESYASKKTRFSVIDLSKIESLVQKFNEVCELTCTKIIDDEKCRSLLETYVNGISATYCNSTICDAKYINFSDFERKIKNKYNAALKILDIEFQELIKQTVCLIEDKTYKDWVFGRYPLTIYFSSINEVNESLPFVNNYFFDSDSDEEKLLFVKEAVKYSAGDEKDSLINRLVYKKFGGINNEK